MLSKMIMQITSIHKIKDKTNSILGDECVCHTDNKRTIRSLIKNVVYVVYRAKSPLKRPVTFSVHSLLVVRLTLVLFV